jgi:hypothetical protein
VLHFKKGVKEEGILGGMERGRGGGLRILSERIEKQGLTKSVTRVTL